MTERQLTPEEIEQLLALIDLMFMDEDRSKILPS